MKKEYLVEVFDKEEGRFIYAFISAFNKNEARRKAIIERDIHVSKRLKNRNVKSYRIGRAFVVSNEIKYDLFNANYHYFGSAKCLCEKDVDIIKRYLVKIESAFKGEYIYLEEYAHSKLQAREQANQDIKGNKQYKKVSKALEVGKDVDIRNNCIGDMRTFKDCYAVHECYIVML